MARGRDVPDLERLLELIAWAHRVLAVLREQTEDEYIRRNLRAIGNALDPDLNPRLGGVAERFEEREGRARLAEHRERIAAAYQSFKGRPERRRRE